MIEQPRPQYQSYLLRLWRADKGKAWRAMLESVDTHERHGFADVEGLCAFLHEQVSDKNQSGKSNDHSYGKSNIVTSKPINKME